MTEPTTAELMKIIAEQQATMQQMLAAIQKGQEPTAAKPVIPALPDVQPFEPTDEKSRITEWLERFRFALDCAAPDGRML